MGETALSDENLELAAALLTKIPELIRRLKHLVQISSKNFAFDLTYNQIGILFLLREHHSLTMSELAKHLDVELSNATQMMDRLHRMDYVKRTSDTRDRRVVRVSLSQKGKDLAEQYYQLHLSAMAHTLEQMDSPQRLNLTHNLQALLSTL